MLRRAVFFAALVTIASSLATRGMAATQHVLGRDQNHNGLWDDLENYLYDAYPASSEDFRAFWQLAGAMQRFMEFGSDPKHVARTTDELRRGSNVTQGEISQTRTTPFPARPPDFTPPEPWSRELRSR
jgi:hypothetical protein